MLFMYVDKEEKNRDEELQTRKCLILCSTTNSVLAILFRTFLSIIFFNPNDRGVLGGGEVNEELMKVLSF